VLSLTLPRDWLTHQHRDTLSSIVGHPTLTSFLAIADGESVGRVKFEMTQVCKCFSRRTVLLKTVPQRMLQPCGPPPPKDED
jgi:splicing factor 3B subunit 5